MNRLPVFLLTALILLGAAVPARALDFPWASLDVCNKGSVPVEVVAAAKYGDLARGFGKYYWDMESTSIATGKCANVYHHSEAPGAYLAFGFYDTKGQWGSGKISQVPDFGVRFVFPSQYPVLKSASKGVCARLDGKKYVMNDDPQTDCAVLRLANDPLPSGHSEPGHVLFLPLTSALYFEPQGQQCTGKVTDENRRCYGGDYYMNISPSATDRELHAVRGTRGGADAPAPVDSATALKNFVALMEKAAADNQQREQQAEAAAREAQQRDLVERAADRKKQQQQILAADAAGNPDVKVEAQMIRREEENNRRRWAGTRQSPAAYDPQWKGQNIAIVGTVSRVEIDPSGTPQWVSIYFKESPDATFVVCSPYPDLFQERVGPNLSALVGKTLEAAGQVESPYCGKKMSKGSIRVLVSTQWQVH